MTKRTDDGSPTETPPAFDPGRRDVLKMAGTSVAAFGLMSVTNIPLAGTQDMSNGADNFYTSDRVTMQGVTFRNQYQMNVVGNLFTPKDLNRSTTHAALVVGHPMGAP